MIFIATNRKNKKREYIKNTIFQGQIVKKGGFILVDVPAGNIEVMRFETPRPQPHPTEMFSVDGLLCEEWHEKIINDFIEIGVF